MHHVTLINQDVHVNAIWTGNGEENFVSAHNSDNNNYSINVPVNVNRVDTNNYLG